MGLRISNITVFILSLMVILSSDTLAKKRINLVKDSCMVIEKYSDDNFSFGQVYAYQKGKEFTVWGSGLTNRVFTRGHVDILILSADDSVVKKLSIPARKRYRMRIRRTARGKRKRTFSVKVHCIPQKGSKMILVFHTIARQPKEYYDCGSNQAVSQKKK